VEQRTCIKFCLRNEYSCADTLKMLRKAFGDQTMAQKNVYKWYNEFKAGRERVEDEPLSGRPLTSTDEGHVQKIKDLVLENRRLTIRDLADSVGISFGSAQTILKDVLCLKRVKSRLVPKSLNLLEKKRRLISRLISFRNHRIRLIWLRATSGYSANSKGQCEDAVSTRLRR
ncbi:hypothetical protein ALC62_09981, partial [Cyphomyrmex costatus]